MTNATTGDLIDDGVSALETAICDIHGIPINTNIANAGFLWDATGLKKVILQDNAADPAAAGELVRNGKQLRWHDGAVRRIPYSIGGSGLEPTVFNTAIQTTVYSQTISGGIIGTDGMLEGYCDLFINTILTGVTLEIRLIYGSQLMFAPQLNNTSGSTWTGFGIRIDFRLGARANSAAAQRWSATVRIGAEVAALNWGGIASLWNVSRAGFLSVDSTIDQNFQVDVIWSSASVSNSLNGEGFEIRRLR